MPDTTGDIAASHKIPALCGNIIGGETYTQGDQIPVICPETEEVVTHAVEADDETLDLAIRTAQETFEQGEWSKASSDHRQKVLFRIADLIEKHQEELAWLETLNIGAPIRQSETRHVTRAVLNFRFFAEYCSQTSGDAYYQQPDYLTVVTREPVGVAALIGPWNAPIALTTMKIAGAIAFGNSCVVKPSEFSPLTAFRVTQLLLEAGLPEGVVNLVNGRGGSTGAALSSHDGIDRLSFTGGTATGRAIMSAAGKNLVPVTLELGGKSANIIFDDADYEQALDGSLLGIFSNNGQQCLAGSRILVQRSIFDRFVADFVSRTNNLRMGSSFDRRTEIGPLATKSHFNRVLSFADLAREEGCEILTGGRAADGYSSGYFFEPTVAVTPRNDLRICQEEIFGPFATIQVFDTPEDAWRIANESDFGLVSYVWTSSLETATTAHKAIKAGMVLINTPIVRELRAPFGGFKDSGVGSESGASCEAFYTEQKTTVIPMAKPTLPKLGSEA
ncbi:aldehyde dehydrogenase [Parvularcula marina]|uniref:aldehyde dehydrogenase n=1 Tax=Parvularcula marina TaxID=2292771 RepID=UPI003515C6AE